VDSPWSHLPKRARELSVNELCARSRFFRHPRINKIADVAEPRPAATLVPVVDARGEAAVVVTRRNSTMRYHRGDWVFPGGRVDAGDRSARDAARREAAEELGVSAQDIDVIAQLDTHGPIVTGFVIEVFVGVIDGRVDLHPNPREVEQVEVLPLSALMEEGVFSRTRSAPTHEPGPLATTAPRAEIPDLGRGLASFALPDGGLIWGTQGEILYNLLEQLCA
jgi:8-oxo-dGTP pyrophosphatase MutT (NUDIX family)